MLGSGTVTTSSSTSQQLVVPPSLEVLNGEMFSLPETLQLHRFAADDNQPSNPQASYNVLPFDQLNFSQLRTPTGGFQCPLCTLPCIDKGLFRRHYRVHSGEKPFVCSFCPHRANRKLNLQVHMMRQHKDQLGTYATIR